MWVSRDIACAAHHTRIAADDGIAKGEDEGVIAGALAALNARRASKWQIDVECSRGAVGFARDG